jgi:tetratricopeptide (TPR) repeat protein
MGRSLSADEAGPGPEITNAAASQWMKRGITLLTENAIQALTESLPCFDEAIRLRRALPLADNAWYRYVLAAGFMNRADALTRLGSLDQAVSSYDDALALLQSLDLEEDSRFRKRLALAWMNRGVTLQQKNVGDAQVSFENAIAFATEPALRAASLTNYGNLLVQRAAPDLVKARRAFEDALRLVTGQQETNADAAEISLKARHGICRILARQLGDEADDELVRTATDAMEDALKLARAWQSRGETRFHELAIELIHFGAQAYRKYQPHFLVEFLTEMLAAFPVRLARRSVP